MTQDNRTDQEKKKRKRKQKSKQTLTRAVPHIRLSDPNIGKLEALDQLASAFMALTQQYVTLFCTQQDSPDGYAEPIIATDLSERWQRVAIQQAAGIAKSWRTNRQNAYSTYLKDHAAWKEAKEKKPASRRIEPVWGEWNRPELRVPSLQANINVAKLEASEASTFDCWLVVATLEKGHPLRIPVKLAPYHKNVLKDRTLNTSVALHKRRGAWWLTVSFDDEPALQTAADAPIIGADVGIANFLTTSDGRTYGTFHGKLAKKHKRDREKRKRKAKLRACLEKKGTPKDKLPSTSSATGQRLGRQVRQDINRAVNQALQDHPDARLIYEDLNVSSMRFHARSMNAYLYASNLGHLPKQLAWACAKRGQAAHTVNPAYSSQECPHCHYVDRANRPTQKTFCCAVCGFKAHADHKAAHTLATRWGDTELAQCRTKEAVKALLMLRHEAWKKLNNQRIDATRSSHPVEPLATVRRVPGHINMRKHL
jgi:transposase